MGAAMGGGMAEAALGAETSSVLTKLTRNTAIIFFVMVFGLGLARIWLHSAEQAADGDALPEFAASDVDTAALPKSLSEFESTADQAAEALGEQVESAATEADAPKSE